MQGLGGVDATSDQQPCLSLQLIVAGKQDELIDKIYSAFAKYRESKQISLLPGPGLFMGDTELDASIAAALSTPVILTMNVSPQMSALECFNHVVSPSALFFESVLMQCLCVI